MRHSFRAITSPVATPAPDRRGVAMMLVLVCVIVGTIMAGVALTTQDHSADLGKNACDTAASGWAAESAADLAVAALQTNASWVDGDIELISSFTFAGGQVTVTVTDLEGNAPDQSDRELIMTASGVVGGVTRQVQKRVTLTPPADLSEAIDPHLGEFAIFAKTKLGIQSGATVSDWEKSPESRSSMPVKIGTGFASAGDLTIASDATVSRVKMYSDSVASTTLDAACTSTAPMSGKVPLSIPAYPELMPSAITSLPFYATALNFNGTVASGTLAFGGRFTSLVVQNGCKLVIDAATAPRFACSALAVRSGATVIIKGNVTIGVFGNTGVNSLGAITLADSSSSLTLYTTGNITIDNAVVGASPDVAADTSRTAAGLTGYVTAGSIKILPVSTASGGASTPSVTLANRAIVCASIHAPTAAITVGGSSWVVGRMTGDTVSIASGSGLLYDPRYDNRVAFTNRYGPFYNADATPVSGLADALASFNPSTGCQNLKTYVPTTVANLTAVVVDVVDGLGGLLGGKDSGTLSATPTATSRSKYRAQASALPMLAMNLEGKLSVADYDDDITDAE